MLRITPLELFFALLPESLILVFGAYVLTNTKLDYKKITITALAIAIATYLIRLLPIFPGINIILAVVISTLLIVFVNRIEIMKTVPASLLLFVIRLLTEGLNMLLLDNVLHIPIEDFLANPLQKILLGMPFLLMFAAIIFIIYKIRYMKKGKKSDVNNR